MTQYNTEQLELVRSDLGDGGWSIHVRRTDIDEDQDPMGPIVGSGEGGQWSKRNRTWTRPNKKDWAAARAAAKQLSRRADPAEPPKSRAQIKREIDEVLGPTYK